MRRAFLAGLLAGAASLANAGAVDEFLAFTSSCRTATARFEQQVLDPRGKVLERSTGTFAFARPGRFRWAYDKPVRTLIVADGTRIWLHDEDLNQVTVRAMDRALSSTPAALLAGKDDVTAVFDLRESGSEGGLAWLEAVPKAKDTGFDRVRVGMKAGAPQAMELHDALGGRTLLRFPEFRANARVDPETFRFTPPKGADVLDEARPAPPQAGGAAPRKP